MQMLFIEINSELTCSLSHGQQRAFPLVAKGSPILYNSMEKLLRLT